MLSNIIVYFSWSVPWMVLRLISWLEVQYDNQYWKLIECYQFLFEGNFYLLCALLVKWIGDCLSLIVDLSNLSGSFSQSFALTSLGIDSKKLLWFWCFVFKKKVIEFLVLYMSLQVQHCVCVRVQGFGCVHVVNIRQVKTCDCLDCLNIFMKWVVR